MERVFLLLGSNVGDRHQYLAQARQALAYTAGPLDAISGVYQSSAWGLTDQPDFLNQAVAVLTTQTPEQLLETIKLIEQTLGRTTTVHWGPRVIDIDILLYGNQVLKSQRLVIPHPELPNRRFALLPLAEIAAEVVHPERHTTVAQLLAACTDTGAVAKAVEN